MLSIIKSSLVVSSRLSCDSALHTSHRSATCKKHCMVPVWSRGGDRRAGCTHSQLARLKAQHGGHQTAGHDLHLGGHTAEWHGYALCRRFRGCVKLPTQCTRWYAAVGSAGLACDHCRISHDTAAIAMTALGELQVSRARADPAPPRVIGRFRPKIDAFTWFL